MRKADPSIRIAVTGAGIICAIGRNKDEVWRAIAESRHGISKLTRFPGESFPTDLAAEGADYYFTRLVRGRRRAPASRVLQQPTSAPSDAVAGVFKLGGGVVSNATACASAGAAIGMAADYLRSGHAGVAVAGGSDALCRLTYSGFNVLQAVDPAPCTPFAADRKGITLGEGAAYLVLERWDDAVARGAEILAELRGYGASCDAHHPTAPVEDGSGAEAAMRAAVGERGGDVDYVNAHGTGTLLNDSAETKAIAAALGVRTPVSSSKSYFGHTLG